MFEARLVQGALLKKIIDAVKDLVENAKWDCSGLVLPFFFLCHIAYFNFFTFFLI